MVSALSPAYSCPKALHSEGRSAMNTTIQRPEDQVLELDFETERERGVTALAVSPWERATVEAEPATPAQQTDSRLERWVRGWFLQWLSLFLFLALVDVVVLLPLAAR